MSKPALVIFDLDNTILNGDSEYAMINYLVHTQALDERAGKQNQIFIEDYQRGELDFDAYTTFALSAYVGMTRSEINEYMLPFVAKVIEPMINTLALKIIHDHGDRGDTIILASATNESLVSLIECYYLIEGTGTLTISASAAPGETNNLALTGKGKYGLRPGQLKFGNDKIFTLTTDSNVTSYLLVTEFRRN